MATMATKKELIQALTDKGLTADSLKGLTNPKLEEMLAAFGDSEIDVAATLEANEDPNNERVADKEEAGGEVVAEFTQQLSIFNRFIYNTRNDGALLIVENLGYGDVYVSDEDNVRVGNEEQRLLFKEQREFKAKRLYFTSSSQPVVQVLEIK